MGILGIRSPIRGESARVVALAGLTVLLFSASPARAQSCAGSASKPPPASLAWVEVPDGSSSGRGEGLTLEVSNTTGRAAAIQIRVVADFGGRRTRARTYELARLADAETTSVPVRFADLGAPSRMHFSGQLYAVATVAGDGDCDDGACDDLRDNPTSDIDADEHGQAGRDAPDVPEQAGGASIAVSASVFFHPAPARGLFEFYGEDALATDHAGGILDPRLVSSTLDDPETVVVRASDAGRGQRWTPRAQAEAAIATIADAQSGVASGPPANDPAPADGYRLCVQWEIQITEQGKIITLPGGKKITEDYWHGYTKPSGGGFKAAGTPPVPGKMTVTARGPRVLVKKGGWSVATWADPATGCFSFTSPEAPPFDLYVYGKHRDKDLNETYVRDKSGNGVAWQRVVNPPKGKTRAVVVGGGDGNATLAAMAAFAAYRTTFGLTGKKIELRPVDTCAKKGLNASSAHVDLSDLDDGLAHLQFSDGTGEASDGSGPCTTSDHRRAKFVVTHELGHAMFLLRTKMAEPAEDYSLSDPTETEPNCVSENLYTPHSMEYSMVGAREGSAHFYSTMVWNNPKDSNAVFSMFGGKTNVETYTNEAGGQLWNLCNVVIKCGRSVNMDWLRFWWDWHTPFKAGKPTVETIARIYERAIGTGGLTPDNYWQKFREAMLVEVADAQQRADFDAYGDWNGVDTSPSGPHCIAPYTYPDCATSPPELGAGEVGCPCTDLLPMTQNNADLGWQDGYFADGQGSYTATGDPQYCLDTPGAPAVCGLVKNSNSSIYAPVCQVCGEDTMLGCPCDDDDECDGLDAEDLDCFGAPANGWQGSKPGTCLPSASSVQGRQRLVDMPWFCLDNCGSKSGGGNNTYACLYDQLGPSYVADHGQCTDVAFCSAPTAHCESAGDFCDPEAVCALEWDDCCVAECSGNADCTGLGFPAFYACDAGSCVPGDCIGSFSQYCSLYR